MPATATTDQGRFAILIGYGSNIDEERWQNPNGIRDSRNGEYTVTIKKKTQPRTLNQNALMWKWFQCIGACLREYTGEEYWSTAAGVQDIHDLYCKKFLVKQVHVNGKVETIVRGTSKLNTLEMHNFMESVKIDAATEFGITLPLPEDQHYLDFIHEYQNRY